MTIYVDITQLEKNRANTGIQRVVKEFIKRASKEKNIIFKIITFDEKSRKTYILDNNEIENFLNDTQNYQFKQKKIFDILSYKPTVPTAFFDIDASWNVVFQRSEIYPILKNNGFLIFNFIYDLVPIILPQYTHEETRKNFEIFLNSVYEYSDLVMFDSLSAQDDFIKVKSKKGITRDIPTRTVGLGSDFLQKDVVIDDTFISSLLQKQYILFVGTIEPRKNQLDIIEAFEVIADKYPNLNLILIGKKGWHVDSLIYKIEHHPLKDKRLFWLNNIDDDTLYLFYKNAFLVTYLSKYEGYGLPIVESLHHGNITITSKNSSMYEVGREFADYILYNSQNELISLISLYCNNEKIYNEKKRFIKKEFQTISWQQFYNSISSIFENYEKSLNLTKNHLKSLQLVFISIDKHNLQGTIKACDKYMDFVKEYIIITQPKLVKKFQTIKTKHKLTIIDETTILGKFTKDFSKRDHQSKNWLLRASLLNLDILEDEFIMLDDDNRPLEKIGIDKFVTDDGRYKAYYFYNMLEWCYNITDYDIGQQNTKKVLTAKNYELFSYSSHAPQIINKKIFKETIEEFFKIGLNSPIDEWSSYFDYAISLYPFAFSKIAYETLSWPANPTDWEANYLPIRYSFENYYKELYDIGFFDKNDTKDDKIEKKNRQLEPYIKSKDMFEKSKDLLSKNNMVHKIALYKSDDVEFYLSGIPYFVIVEEESDVKLRLNYKLYNPTKKELNISVVIFLDGNYRTLRVVNIKKDMRYQEAIIELPILSKNLLKGMYELSINVMINSKYIYNNISPYRMKMIVSKDEELYSVLGGVEVVEIEEERPKSLKERIKAIPILGWLARWSYNLLRLNNLKYRVYRQQQEIIKLKEEIEELNLIINNQQNSTNEFQKLIQQLIQSQKKLENNIENSIAEQISFQSDLCQQRLDQFIFDTKIELGIKNSAKDDK